MAGDAADEDIADFLRRWVEALEKGDAEAAAALREPGYTAALPADRVLTREQELAMIASAEVRIASARVGGVEVRRRGNEAVVRFENSVDTDYHGESFHTVYRCELRLVRSAAGWRARRATIADGAAAGTGAVGSRGRAAKSLLPAGVRRVLRGARRTLRAVAARDLAYIPYAGGADFLLPRRVDASPADALPVPPRRLWLGYDYPAHGKRQVETMLELATDSGLTLGSGDRILDLGCGAGRMIRHLRHLADRCEIWGADISADHVYWCKQNLSPPFHFLVNTRMPHLPFEDRSFSLIYGGSLFTHIDELADAWLLELHRILRPEGRVYLTIHDRHTVELFDDWRYATSPTVKEIKANPVFREAAEPFDLLVVGRGEDPQIFYDIDHFARMAAPAFDILSVTPEAYFYQTAVLMKRSRRGGG